MLDQLRPVPLALDDGRVGVDPEACLPECFASVSADGTSGEGFPEGSSTAGAAARAGGGVVRTSERTRNVPFPRNGR